MGRNWFERVLACLMTAEMNSCEILNLFSSISNTFSVFMAKFFTSELANEWNNLAMKTENKLEIELNKLRIKPRIHFCQMRQTSTIGNYNFYPKEYSFLLWLIFFKWKRFCKKIKWFFYFTPNKPETKDANTRVGTVFDKNQRWGHSPLISKLSIGK